MTKVRCVGVTVPEFVEGEGRNFAARRLIQVVASAASGSQLPIAAAICEYYRGAYLAITDSVDESDGGFRSTVEGNVVRIFPNGEAYSGDSYIGRVEWTYGDD
ncbi:MAG: hypothetical protein LBC65_00440 [Oscillospiraceae bacterium]|nr:hypothetical protein [Oscillospiraceae bacterium]